MLLNNGIAKLVLKERHRLVLFYNKGQRLFFNNKYELITDFVHSKLGTDLWLRRFVYFDVFCRAKKNYRVEVIVEEVD